MSLGRVMIYEDMITRLTELKEYFEFSIKYYADNPMHDAEEAAKDAEALQMALEILKGYDRIRETQRRT